MLDFAEPTLADAPRVRRAAEALGAVGNEWSFVNLFLLRKKHRVALADADGYLFRRYDGARLSGYGFPARFDGIADEFSALERVRRDAAERGRPAVFTLLTEAQRDRLDAFYPGKYVFSADRGDADYLYARQRLAETSGRALHRKRNFIARFERRFVDRRFEPLTPRNAADALEVAERWLAERADAATDANLAFELAAIREAFDHWDALRLRGAVLYVDGRARGMTAVSAIVPTVVDVHFAKAVAEAKEAYPLLHRETARLFPEAQYVNFEEDLNVAGLRAAKAAYFPAFLLTKYVAAPNDFRRAAE